MFTDFNIGDSRYFSWSDRNIHRICTQRSSLFHDKVISSGCINRIRSISNLICTINRSCHIIDIPLVSEILNVVVVNMTSEVNHTVFTYCCIVNSNSSNRSGFDVNLIRFAHDSTTCTKIDLDRIAIRFILSLTRSKIFLIVNKDRCGGYLSHTCRNVI